MEANDMKAMREALVKMTDWMEKHTAAFSVQVYPRHDDHDEVERERDEVISMARAALAKPPRNCDRFGGETEAMVAFLNTAWLVAVEDLKEYPFCEWSPVMKARYAKWLMTKEGGAEWWWAHNARSAGLKVEPATLREALKHQGKGGK